MIVYVITSIHWNERSGGIEVMFDNYSKAAIWVAEREAIAEHEEYIFTIREHMVY